MKKSREKKEWEVASRVLQEKTSWDTARLLILQILWGIVHSANLDFKSLIWDEFEWQVVNRTTKPTKMSKLIYTRFTKLIIDHFLLCNKSIPCRYDSNIRSEGQDLPLTKLTNIVKGNYIIRMEILDTMIDDAFKKSSGYKYYRAKKVESEKAKAVNQLVEQHESLVRSRRGKGYMRSGDQEANVPNAFKKNDVSRKTRYLIVADKFVEERTAVELIKSLSHIVEDPDAQLLLDLCKGPKASKLESLKHAKQAVVGKGSSAAHNKYHEFENILATDNEPRGDDDAAGFRVFMYNKSNITHSNLTYLIPRNLVYTDAQTTSAVIYLEENPELTSYILGASEVPLGTRVDVQSTNIVLQEMFPDEAAHHI
ncbi:hypothetical protein Tco_1176184 [Tanacetum coccineum]